MTKMSVEYLGDLRCETTHGPSGAKIITDAPKSVQGLGEAFSPTDLCALALSTCMANLMAKVAVRRDIDLHGMRIETSKEMAPPPARYIGRVALDFHVPVPVAPEHRKILERAAATCPVVNSLHPQVRVEAHYPG